MPHVIVKMISGRTDQQKARIADAITEAVTSTANVGEASVSVSIEDVPHADWTRQVYEPDIAGRPATLVRKPGYGPF